MVVKLNKGFPWSFSLISISLPWLVCWGLLAVHFEVTSKLFRQQSVCFVIKLLKNGANDKLIKWGAMPVHLLINDIQHRLLYIFYATPISILHHFVHD